MRLNLTESKYVIKNLLLAVQELHNSKYLHTDLKTDNILSDKYSDKNLEFVEWFKTLKINIQYNNLLELNTPKDIITLDKNKRKMLKRKIKKKNIESIINIY